MKKLNMKKFKFGAGNAVVVTVVVVCAILLNIIASLTETKVPALKIDLTRDSITKLSAETKNVLTELDKTDKKITVTELVGTSDEDSNTRDILQQYDILSENITLTKENYVKNPSVLTKYGVESDYAEGAVVVAGDNKTRVITAYDMWPEASTYGALGYGKFMLESLMTNALGYVMSDQTANVCISTGHNEADPTVLAYTLQNENVNVTQLDLSTGDIPENTDFFMILSPQTDFTQLEIDALDTYLNKGGNAAVAFPLDVELPKLESYLKDWGVSVANDVLLEQDSSQSFQQSGIYFYPQLQQSAVTAGIEENVLLSWARSMTVEPTGDITASPIMTTSPDTYSVPFVNHELDDANKKQGQYNVGYILEKPIGNSLENTSKLIVTSTSSAWGVLNNVGTELDQYILYALTIDRLGTKKFLMNSINYAAGFENVSVYVPDKEASFSVLNLPSGAKSIYSTVLCVVVPLTILAAGIFVWVKRRNL